jgi:hypothetical protein
MHEIITREELSHLRNQLVEALHDAADARAIFDDLESEVDDLRKLILLKNDGKVQFKRDEESTYVHTEFAAQGGYVVIVHAPQGDKLNIAGALNALLCRNRGG